MESLKSFHDHLENLQHQARKLISAGLSLTELFAEEAKRLSKEDEASRLIALHSSISQQLDQAKSSEGAASYGHSQAKLITSLGGLIVGSAIKMTSKDKQLLAFSDHLLKNLGGKRRPFGMVLVCIGPKGLPDDVGVVSISRLARESNREESQVINELKERGHLLLSENAFSLLIDKLINDVQEGRLLLPISKEKLSEIKPLSCLKPVAKKSEWVPYSRL
jgi:hypothetical protein